MPAANETSFPVEYLFTVTADTAGNTMLAGVSHESLSFEDGGQ